MSSLGCAIVVVIGEVAVVMSCTDDSAVILDLVMGDHMCCSALGSPMSEAEVLGPELVCAVLTIAVFGVASMCNAVSPCRRLWSVDDGEFVLLIIPSVMLLR